MDGKRIIPDVVLASMGTDHVVSGGPGPLFGAGWAAACEYWSKKLLEMPPYEAVEKDAARYRWWVENYGTEHDSPISRKIYVVVPHFKGKLDTKEKFDAAFDAAMLPSRSSESK